MSELPESTTNASPYIAAAFVTALFLTVFVRLILRDFTVLPENIGAAITFFVVFNSLYPFIRRVVTNKKGRRPLSFLRWFVMSTIASVAIFLLDVLIDGHL